jgi:hypothetical protein
MTTAWSHLPNAAHIDRIIADLKVNINNWNWAYSAAWDAARSAAWDRARAAAWAASWDDARSASWAAARFAARDADWGAARTTIVALIVWPESAEYLDLSVESVRVLALLGDQRAVLMLPAVIAFERSKESV